MNIRQELIKMRFIQDGENSYIWKYRYHYIRVYIDKTDFGVGYNIRASKFVPNFVFFYDPKKFLRFAEKLQRRLKKDILKEEQLKIR